MFRVFHDASMGEDYFVADGQIAFQQISEKEQGGYKEFWV